MSFQTHMPHFHVFASEPRKIPKTTTLVADALASSEPLIRLIATYPHDPAGALAHITPELTGVDYLHPSTKPFPNARLAPDVLPDRSGGA